MKTKTPDSRLRAAAEFVRQGAIFADIGTDHAYLPVFLLENGKIKHAYAADIGEGPLNSAKRTVEESGFKDRVTLVLTDGLAGLENRGITDIAICGMGGELIRDILDRAPFVKDKRVRLILQPMTRAADLRRFLAKEGFLIVEERIAKAQGKLYFCLAAEYTGKAYTLSRVEEELGRFNIEQEKKNELFFEMLEQKIRAASRRISGLSKTGSADAEEEKYLASLIKLRS